MQGKIKLFHWKEKKDSKLDEKEKWYDQRKRTQVKKREKKITQKEKIQKN